jgi:hypothetical protein
MKEMPTHTGNVEGESTKPRARNQHLKIIAAPV